MSTGVPAGCPEQSLHPSASRGQHCGAAPAVDGNCLAHLSTDRLQAYLADLAPGADVDAGGVVFTADLLQHLLTAARTGDQIELGNVDFSVATFTEDANFSAATFTKVANFSDVTFAASADFGRAAFTEDADFRSATFTGDAYFRFTTFIRDVDFSGGRVEGRLELVRCAALELVWAGARISGELVVEAAVAWVDLSGARASGRVGLRLRGARVDLSEAVFTGPVTVHGLQTAIDGVDEAASAWEGAGPGGPAPRVKLVSLRGADAERLVLTDVDLSECGFAGMQQLEKITLDGRCRFATDPRGRRQMLAEEHHWRAAKPRWPAGRGGLGVGRPRRTGWPWWTRRGWRCCTGSCARRWRMPRTSRARPPGRGCGPVS
ncbi:hypothetical protein OHR68_13770 [Spirillospora sp. NBC_00431]